ncbi:ABC-type transporter Mla subunit MlaD [Sinorhizobium fredii]
MTYDWDGKRTRRLQMLKFVGALAIAALLFGSTMAALQRTDTDGPSVRTALR